MASDRVIYWNTKDRPTRLDLRYICEDFLSGIGNVVWNKDRFFCNITGAALTCFSRVRPEWNTHVRIHESKVRWIEVWPDDDCVYVMTRSSDELTNSIANGLAKVIARAWDGRIEE